MKGGFLCFLGMIILATHMNCAYAQEKDEPICHTISTVSVAPPVLAAVTELVLYSQSKPIETVLRDDVTPLAKSITAKTEQDNPGKQEIIGRLVENDFVSPIVAHQTELDMYVTSVYAANLTVSDMQQLTAYYKWRKTVDTKLASSKDESELPAPIQTIDSFNHSDLAKREADDVLKTMHESVRVAQCVGGFVLDAKLRLIDDFKKNNLIVPQDMQRH